MTDAAHLRDEHVEVDVVQSDLVYTGKVWDVRSDTFRYGDEQIVRQYVDHTGAAAIVAVDDQDRVLLIQQYRHPITQRDWEIPAGLLDVEGEAPLTSAKRELAEEADLVAADWEQLVSIYSTPGGNNEIIHIFLARGLSAAPTVHERSDEEADIRVEWVALTEAVDAVLEGRMRNGILATGVLATTELLRRRGAAALTR